MRSHRVMAPKRAIADQKTKRLQLFSTPCQWHPCCLCRCVKGAAFHSTLPAFSTRHKVIWSSLWKPSTQVGLSSPHEVRFDWFAETKGHREEAPNCPPFSVGTESCGRITSGLCFRQFDTRCGSRAESSGGKEGAAHECSCNFSRK